MARAIGKALGLPRLNRRSGRAATTAAGVDARPLDHTGPAPSGPEGVAPPVASAGVSPGATGSGRALAGAILLLGAVGLTTPAASAERGPVKSLLEMRRENVVVQDFDLSCGAAALATLLNYQHGEAVTEREVAEGLIRREEYLANPELVKIRQGFSLLDLKRYVEGRGYEGIGYGQLGFEDLIDLAPVMVPVDFNGYNHFVIVRGAVGDRVVLADPAWGNRTMAVERFEDSWLEYPEIGKVGFAVARRDGAEPPGELGLRRGDIVTAPDAVLRRVLSSLRS